MGGDQYDWKKMGSTCASWAIGFHMLHWMFSSGTIKEECTWHLWETKILVG